MQTKAFVLINTTQGKAKEASTSIKQIEAVKSVHVVTGPYDVVAVVEAKDFTEMGDIVTSRIAHISGVERWMVCAEYQQ